MNCFRFFELQNSKIGQKKNSFKKRNRQIDGYISQVVGLLFKQVKQLNIDTIVIGMNEGWKQHVNLGKKTNQNFVQIPFAKLLAAIENKCLKEGIRFVKQEESYTSKASFLDRDVLPTWHKEDTTKHAFSGRRINRGQYRSRSGRCIHADINGALNILRKADVVEISDILAIKNPILLYVQTCKNVA